MLQRPQCLQPPQQLLPMHRQQPAAGAAATEYLHLMGYVAVGWQWLRMATVSQQQLAAGQGEKRFHEAKLKTARFYFSRLLPETATLLTAIQSGAAAAG